MKKKLVAIGTVAVLAIALVFAMCACTEPGTVASVKDGVDKIAAENAQFTMTMVMKDAEGAVELDETFKVNGKQYYAMRKEFDQSGKHDGNEYVGLIKEGDKYFEIEGSGTFDETGAEKAELFKREITAAEFEENYKINLGMAVQSINPTEVETYFIEKDGKYVLNPEKYLDYFNSKVPEGQKVTELPAEQIAVFAGTVLELADGKIRLSTTMGQEGTTVCEFSEIGTTVFKNFTDAVPTLVAPSLSPTDALKAELAKLDVAGVTYTMTVEARNGTFTQTMTFRVSGKQFYATTWLLAEEETAYKGQVKEGDKFYDISGSQDTEGTCTLSKREITETEFLETYDTSIGMIRKMVSLDNFTNYYIVSEGAFVVNPDKYLEFYNLGLPPESQPQTELSEEELLVMASVRLTFVNGETAFHMSGSNGGQAVTFSGIGTTEFKNFTDVVPTPAA